MTTFDMAVVLFMFGLLIIFVTLGNDKTRLLISDTNAEIITELKNSNQIELELIDAVNSAIKHIETDPTNFDCQEVAKFLRGVQRARRNLNPEKYGD